MGVARRVRTGCESQRSVIVNFCYISLTIQTRQNHNIIMRSVYFFGCILFLGLNFLEACRARRSDQSCKARCWQNFNRNDPCHCNSQCQNHNNCCDDFEDQCLTCQNKCGRSFNRNYGCQVKKSYAN